MTTHLPLLHFQLQAQPGLKSQSKKRILKEQQPILQLSKPLKEQQPSSEHDKQQRQKLKLKNQRFKV
jgi:hypothetical protein